VTIIEKLKKYKISTAHYREEQQALRLLGYTDKGSVAKHTVIMYNFRSYFI